MSVIVPIYNVKSWLRKCLDSLIGQSLKQIEIIMIDDGSTDGSSEIADEYVEDLKWPRFRVFHIENRGLSAARNYGINEAQSEWLMFVDGDDWVEKEFCRIPYMTVVVNKADMVIFRSIGEWSRLFRKKWMNNYYPTGIVDEFTAHQYGSGVAWNKLYRRKLFDDIRYPEKRVYEDLATTHKLVHESKRIVMIENYLYHHIVRKNSISHTHNDSNRIDGLISAKERYTFLISCGCPKEVVVDSLCGYALGYLLTEKSDEDLRLFAKNMLDSVNGIPKVLPIKQRCALVMWKINKKMFYIYCKITKPF